MHVRWGPSVVWIFALFSLLVCLTADNWVRKVCVPSILSLEFSKSGVPLFLMIADKARLKTMQLSANKSKPPSSSKVDLSSNSQKYGHGYIYRSLNCEGTKVQMKRWEQNNYRCKRLPPTTCSLKKSKQNSLRGVFTKKFRWGKTNGWASSAPPPSSVWDGVT